MRLALFAVLGLGAAPYVLGRAPNFGRVYAEDEYPLPTQTYDVCAPPLRLPSWAKRLDEQMPIDHFGGSVHGTFQNRWWYNDTFLKPGGPIFRTCLCFSATSILSNGFRTAVYDAGELDASASIDFLLEPNGTKTAVMQLAQRYHGLAILWEHRLHDTRQPVFVLTLHPGTMVNHSPSGPHPQLVFLLSCPRPDGTDSGDSRKA
jgi:hypothetical protein